MHANYISFRFSLFEVKLANLIELSLVQALDRLHFSADDLNVVFGSELLRSHTLLERDQSVLGGSVAHRGGFNGA